MGYMVLTDFHTFAQVILHSDRIIEVTETKLRGTCLRTEYTACPSVYVREPAQEVYWTDWVIAWKPLPKPYKPKEGQV